MSPRSTTRVSPPAGDNQSGSLRANPHDCHDAATHRRKRRAAKTEAVRSWLIEAIASGEFSRGQQLPSENAVAAHFDVSRATVRQAFHELCERGVINSRQGSGYFVSRLTAVHDLERLQSFGEMMAPLGLDTHSVVVELCEVACDAEVANALDISPASPVVKTVRKRLAGGTVVSLDVSYFPLDLGRKLSKLDLEHNDIFHLLENDLGVELGFADLVIEIATCEEVHAKLLGVDSTQPVIRIRRLCHDNSGRPIDYEHLYARQDVLRFKVRTSRW